MYILLILKLSSVNVFVTLAITSRTSNMVLFLTLSASSESQTAETANVRGGFNVFDLFPMTSHEPKPFGDFHVEEKK
jgi:hypothetical protein